jgi:hypothetical protein
VAEVAIRLAEARDAEGIARVHASAWREAFTFLPSHFLEAMTPSAVLEKWKDAVLDPTTSLFVAVDDEFVFGFLHVRADGHDGEVMALYVDPPSKMSMVSRISPAVSPESVTCGFVLGSPSVPSIPPSSSSWSGTGGRAPTSQGSVTTTATRTGGNLGGGSSLTEPERLALVGRRCDAEV